MGLQRGILLGTVFFIALLMAVPVAMGKIGVGVNLGKISIDEPLAPGGIYRLPSVGVINTGDETKDYTLDVTYQYKQKELEPSNDWFIFTPKIFTLKPGKSQTVDIRLNLPINARPGDYFAFIEAHPTLKAKRGVAIGIAAASKLYFTIKPANLWSAILNKLLTFLQVTSPYSYIILGAIGFALIILLFRRFFRLTFRVERRR